METIDPRKLLAAVAKILNDLEIPYMVTGGMAVFVWGRPRFTADIDIVVELEETKMAQLAKALSKELTGYIDEMFMRQALAQKGEFNFIETGTGLKVDFWVLQEDPFDRSRIERRTPKDILGESVYFTSPEDLILIKLKWYKESGSSRHLEDAESVIKIQGDNLDKTYLQKWAQEQSTLEILKKLLAK
jgi:predicted nucleotidyltransferase